MSVPNFMSLVRKHYSIDVTRDQCYKAKNLANERIQGSIEEQYAKLWDYCEELKRQNPGSNVLVKTLLRGDDSIFLRLYICFAQLRKEFIEGCRTMVGFDGAFIKGQHPGQLLSAVGIDANNGMFPITFAVMETERLGQAIKALKPDVEHRHCVRHLHNNFKVARHGSLALKQRLWAAARSTTLPWWAAEMDNIMEISAPVMHGLKIGQQFIGAGLVRDVLNLHNRYEALKPSFKASEFCKATHETNLADYAKHKAELDQMVAGYKEAKATADKLEKQIEEVQKQLAEVQNKLGARLSSKTKTTFLVQNMVSASRLAYRLLDRDREIHAAPINGICVFQGFA
ncbi:uncharacterized protein LOC117630376 [Prunus dulcis]|uniref:uncharacterized protein LOC117630376 n=1 Tax=Prunus dulcis TaxID=3755 RepID=UPI001483CDF2|nr:uncharacterized protein LOC117630376 [Prunus dulcis]